MYPAYLKNKLNNGILRALFFLQVRQILLYLFCVVVRDEGVSGALTTTSSRATDSMNVIFNLYKINLFEKAFFNNCKF